MFFFGWILYERANERDRSGGVVQRPGGQDTTSAAESDERWRGLRLLLRGDSSDKSTEDIETSCLSAPGGNRGGAKGWEMDSLQDCGARRSFGRAYPWRSA